MSDILGFAELDEQRVELLPTRIVLSLFSASLRTSDPVCDSHNNCSYFGGDQDNSGSGNYGNSTYGPSSHQTNTTGGSSNGHPG